MATTNDVDILVVGGGIAGVSLGYELAAERSVALLEMESTLAFHTTGRSAATWVGTYGNEPIRALTAASRHFLTDPLAELFEARLTTPLELICIGGQGQANLVRALHDDVKGLAPDVKLVDGAAATAMNPLLRTGYVELAMVEPGALNIDVHELHTGYTRGLRARGGRVITAAQVALANRVGQGWAVTTENGDV
jgi:D-arginine dehydrogenase